MGHQAVLDFIFEFGRIEVQSSRIAGYDKKVELFGRGLTSRGFVGDRNRVGILGKRSTHVAEVKREEDV